MSNNGIILDLQQSHCSNHLGVSVLAFTSDGYMVVTVQTSESAQSPNLYTPSGSGSADLKDFRKNPKTFIISATERELMEECGLIDDAKQRKSSLVRTHLVGFARNLNRGGKPEFFGVSFIDVPFRSLRVTRKEAVLITDIKDIRSEISQIDKLKMNLQKYRNEKYDVMSLALYLNLLFVEDYLGSYPLLFQKLICHI